MPPIRVLHLIWALDLGGAERQVVELVRRTDPTRFHLHVGCLVRTGLWGRQLRDSGVPVEDFGKRPGMDLRALFRLVRYLREQRVDVLHTHTFTAAATGRVAALLAGTRHVVAHEHSAFSLSSGLHRLVDRCLIPATDRYILVGTSLARDLVDGLGLPESKVAVVPNGIPCDEPPPAEEARRVRQELTPPGATKLVGCIGRLEERKGLDVFLSSFASLLEGDPSVGAVLVGEGPLDAPLRAQARELGIEARVTFAGRREDVPAALAALDVYVLPSRTEGLSIALLEAASAGRPIVATAVGGNQEIVTDGVSGLIVAPADPVALTRAMARMLESGDAAAAMGRQAAQTVRRRFSSQRMARDVAEVYLDLARPGELPPFKRRSRLVTVKRVVRRAVASLYSSLRPAQGREGVRILTYHRVNDSHPGDRLTVHPVSFARQMELLRRSGRPIATLQEIVETLRSGGSLPERAVAVTFDDGYMDNFEVADPILRRFEIPATFFVPTALIGTTTCIERYSGCCDRDGCFGWDEAREMALAGHELGAHGRSHAELAQLSDGEARSEIEGSRDELARETGGVPRSFCYPRGSHSERTRQLVAAAGFTSACSVRPGGNAGDSDLFSLRRTEVSGSDSIRDFEVKLSGVFDAWHSRAQMPQEGA